MTSFVFLVCAILGAVAATTPLADDNVAPVEKPGTSVPRICPENEVLKARYSCPPDTCDTLWLSYLCAAEQTQSLSCTCKEGYLRTNSSASGVCVPQDRCLPSECADDPNAQRGCGNRCKKTCADYNDTTKECPLALCSLFGCDCKDGFVYDESIKKCVKPEQCTKQCNKPHERYSNCLLGECVPKTCDEVGYPVACPDIIGPCAGGCTCEEGYVRDRRGNCIPMKDCPSCGGDPNAVSGCGNPCGKTCDDLYTNASSLICPLYCEYNGCDCKPGYRLINANTESKKCIPEGECPKQPKCKGPFEQYIDCPAGQCTPKTCEDLVTPPGCPRIKPPCPGGCVCQEGYLRNSKGICIKKEQCQPKCKGPFEKYIDCPAGQCTPKTCRDLVIPPGCPRIKPPCPGGCVCQEGYLRNSKGICIKKEQCQPKCKGPFEQYVNCPAGQYTPKTCRDLITPRRCPRIKPPCRGGCVCQRGYLRNSKGICIKKEQCQPKCKGPFEKYIDCPAGQCTPKTCEDLVTPPGCPRIKPPCPGGCVCQEGYLRNSKGICIKKEQCKPCKGPFEQYIDCPAGQCNPKTCEDLITPPGCPRIIPPCPGGCVCQEGYLRNSKGICIKQEQCPNKCKGPHERFISCPIGQCIPKTCQDLITPPGCPRVRPPCPGGCICEEGYLRNSLGICIKQEECPKACSANQTYVSCNGNCPDKYCPKDDQPQPVCEPPINCQPGCTCKINYRYDQSGKCILASECPPVNCTGPNTVWDPCPSDCLSEQCEDADSPPVVCNTLLLNCQPKCVCKEGHFRNKDGVCIPAKECPSVCKDPNASWTDCKDACPATCANTRPGCVNKKCSAGCQCNKGYVLSKEGGKCVKVETCADYAECGANQTYVECTFRCPQVVCPTSDATILCKPPRDCPGGCGCKPNYRYNPDGNCVKTSDCPPVECTRPNEEWTSCHLPSDWENCEDRFNSPPFVPDDPNDCTPKCKCKPGYWRNGFEGCVPENECPMNPVN